CARHWRHPDNERRCPRLQRGRRRSCPCLHPPTGSRLLRCSAMALRFDGCRLLPRPVTNPPVTANADKKKAAPIQGPLLRVSYGESRCWGHACQFVQRSTSFVLRCTLTLPVDRAEYLRAAAPPE